MNSPTSSRRTELWQLAAIFLRLGLTSFGGPAAHIALMEREFVRTRGWLTHEEFLDLLGAANLIPGPNSTEMAIHIGLRRAGAAGLVIAGVAFILPAALIVTCIAWAYVKFGKLPQAAGLLLGVKPVIIAIILQALWLLGRKAVKNRRLAIAGLICLGLGFCNVNELVLLFGTGLLIASLVRKKPGLPGKTACLLPFWAALPGASATVAGTSVAAPFGLWPLFGFFLKVGAILFGSGYVLLAFLRADLVERWHWLSESQLIDAIAVGQFTPGPLFTTATFIGYLLGGGSGAAVATVGIFLPAFILVAISSPWIPRLRQSAVASAFLDGVNVASLALMAVVTWQLGAATLVDIPSCLLALVASGLLWWGKLNSVWLVTGGAAVGLALSWLY
jgi:chromate transporter